MNLEPRKMIYLLRRELYEFRSSRLLAAFGIFGLLQGVIMFSARAHGRTEDTILVFLIGGLSTVITAFDLVAREREQHTIDLLLTQGVSRTSLFLAKGLTAFLFSVIGALVFCVATVSGTAIAGYPVLWGDLLPEFGMITWMMGAYAAIALACSVIFRRPKTALIGAMMTWVILRPTVISLLIIDPIQKAFQLDKNQIWRVVAFIPEFAFRLGLDINKAAPKDVSIPPAWPYLSLAGYILVFSLLAWLIFLRQDEPIQ